MARLRMRLAMLPLLALLAAPVSAATIANPVATFSGLDKITGRITNFDVYIDETVQFGALQITPRACYTRPPTETQHTSVFVEVDQVSLQQTVRRIFTGWMFADSPALNAIDHAVYDIWLIDCKQTSDVPPPDTRGDEAAPAGVPAATPPQPAPVEEPSPAAAPPEQPPVEEAPGEETPPIPDEPANTPSFVNAPPPSPLGTDSFARP